MEPHGQARGSLYSAYVGRHPGRKLAHSSTAKAVVFCCRDKREMDMRTLVDINENVLKEAMEVSETIIPSQTLECLSERLVSGIFFKRTINTTPTIHKIPLIPPLLAAQALAQRAKGGNCYPPLWKRGARGDFLTKPLNISVLHRAINAICRSSIKSNHENSGGSRK